MTCLDNTISTLLELTLLSEGRGKWAGQGWGMEWFKYQLRFFMVAGALPSPTLHYTAEPLQTDTSIRGSLVDPKETNFI